MWTLGNIDEVAVQLPDVETVGGAVRRKVLLGRRWKGLGHVEHRGSTGWLRGMATAPTTPHGKDPTELWRSMELRKYRSLGGTPSGC